MMQQQENDLTRSSQEFSILSSTPSIWKMMTSAIQTLSEDCTFEIDADGLSARTMDPSHVAMLYFKFPFSSFEKFQCSKPAKFTVHVEDFSRIIKRSEQKEVFEISRERNNKALEIRIGSGHYRKEFELHLIDDDLKSSPLPKLTFTTRFSLSLQAFQQMLNDVSAISTHVSVAVSTGKVLMSGKGDSGKAVVSLGSEDGALLQEAIVDNGSSETKAVYNLEYLLKIVKAVSSFSDFVRFEFSTKMPLKLDFTVGTENKSQPPIQFYLAPKMVD